MLCRDLLAFAPRLDPASRTLTEVQDRFASKEGRRRRLLACRLPARPTSTAGGHWWRRSGLRSARQRDTHDPPTRCCARLSQPDRQYPLYAKDEDEPQRRWPCDGARSRTGTLPPPQVLQRVLDERSLVGLRGHGSAVPGPAVDRT